MKTIKKVEQTECRRCGTCCKKGGPALHKQDIGLIESGKLQRESLITIRQGELAYNPVTESIQPVKNELVKIRGNSGEWSCLFYNESNKECMIHAYRPYACRVLKCWDPQELLDLVGRDTLTRFDLLAEEDPLFSFFVEHERLFACPDMEELANWTEDEFREKGDELEKLVVGDLTFRDQLVRKHNLQLNDEMILFGRPIFQLLQPLGFSVVQDHMGIRLNFLKKKISD